MKKPARRRAKSDRSSAAEIRSELGPFFEANPDATLTEKDGKFSIERPWGDRSVTLVLPQEENEREHLNRALNNLLLPARYSAIWHRDTKDFEVLWTAFKVTGAAADVIGRSFSYRFRGKEYRCEFGRSSDRVIALAKASFPVGPSETDYRNLPPFDAYARNDAPTPLLGLLGTPNSFWIRDLDWNEDDVLALISHLNFHINYFDLSSPVVMIHSPPYAGTFARPTRYPAGAFPGKIIAMETDATILNLWSSARTGDPTQRFLYYYRILEYSASAYLDASARSALRMALALPNALDDLSGLTESVVAAVQRMKMDDFARYETMLREIIDPKLLWRELSLNLSAFTSETEFDGGFRQPALMAAGRTATTFTVQDVATFARAIRDIRNALSHGRDQKSGATITPSTHNSARLQPWVGPVRLAASQVVLYKEAL
jgi:hypothetical protein